jgi:hypothetical protein
MTWPTLFKTTSFDPAPIAKVPSLHLLRSEIVLRLTLTVLLHDLEELDDDLGGRSDEDLPLALPLGVDNAVQAVVQDRNTSHLGCDANEPYDVSAVANLKKSSYRSSPLSKEVKLDSKVERRCSGCTEKGTWMSESSSVLISVFQAAFAGQYYLPFVTFA